MTAALVRQHGAVQVRTASPWRRARARLLGSHLDQELARGVSPDASVEHALRATLLATRAQRESTASALDRVLHEAVDPARPTRSSTQPMARSTRVAVSANAYELTCVVRRLASPEPVSPQGLALARILTTDGAGPLHYGNSAEALRLACMRILDTLDPAVEPR
jgi:hypothetical protein